MKSRTKFLLALAPFWLIPFLSIALALVDAKNSKHFVGLPFYAEVQKTVQLIASLSFAGPLMSIWSVALIASLLGLLVTCRWQVQRVMVFLLALCVTLPPSVMMFVLSRDFQASEGSEIDDTNLELIAMRFSWVFVVVAVLICVVTYVYFPVRKVPEHKSE